MDMEILLWLQEFREGAGSFLSEFLAKMTFLGELNTVLVIMAVLYWGVHKELGAYLLMGWSGNRLVNGVLKVSFCSYRPWIRDPRILPYGNSMNTATGYSFPSGHSMNAATVYGGGMLRRDFPRALRITLGLIVALVALSRLYLGVHTPQDVLVGAGMGLLVMFITREVLVWLADHPEKDVVIMGIGLFLGLIIAVYAGLKAYPAKYDDAGKLLVDGAKMANDTFKGVGWCAGFLVSWVMERHFVGFRTAGIPLPHRLIRLVLGVAGYFAVSDLLVPQIKAWIPGAPGNLYACFLQMVCLILILPWIMKALEGWITRKTKEKKA